MVYGINVFIGWRFLFLGCYVGTRLTEKRKDYDHSIRRDLLHPVNSLIFHRTRNVKINTVKTSNLLCLSVIYDHRNSGVTNVTGLQTALKFFYSDQKHMATVRFIYG